MAGRLRKRRRRWTYSSPHPFGGARELPHALGGGDAARRGSDGTDAMRGRDRNRIDGAVAGDHRSPDDAGAEPRRAATAELTDNAGWELLTNLAAKAGEDALAEQFSQALADEQQHQAIVMGWVKSLLDDAAGTPAV